MNLVVFSLEKMTLTFWADGTGIRFGLHRWTLQKDNADPFGIWAYDRDSWRRRWHAAGARRQTKGHGAIGMPLPPHL